MGPKRLLPIYFAAFLLNFYFPGLVAAEVSSCDSRGLRSCVETRGCFLDCEGPDEIHCKPYRCRTASGTCENAFAQFDLSKEKCETLADCQFKPAVCFCPGPENCFCGGGAPPRCIKK